MSTNLIDFQVDVVGGDSLLSMLANVREQVPYVMAVTINRTAEEVLAEGRKEIQANFIVRSPAFDLPPVQLPKAWRATKTRQIATVNLGDDGNPNDIGPRRRKIFTKFEYGGEKVAADPAFPIAIPTTAIRSSKTALVPRALYPTQLRLAPRKQADGSTLPALRKGKIRTLAGSKIGKRARNEAGLQGIGGTFTMTNSDGKPIGVFQRVGSGHRGYRMIWAFRARISIPKRMHFRERGTVIIETRFKDNFDGALELAIRTAR